MFAQGSFINDANLTPEQIARKRELIASLMPRFGDAKYVGEGLGQLFYGIGMGRAQKRLDQAETEGRAKADDIFSRVIANPRGNGGFSILGTTPASMPAPQNMPTGPVKIDNTPTAYDPKAPWAIGMDTMTALGKTPSADHLAKGLEARGFAQPAAQGAVMAMNDESGLNPSVNEVSPLVPGSRGGFGLNQWTGPRRVALEKFAADTGRDVRDPQVQLDFMAQEMAGPEASAGRSVMSAATPQDAAIKMTTDYLRPADPTARVAKYGGQPQAPQIPTDMLYSALSNPWLSPEQKSVIASLIQKQTDAADPMKALELQRAQLEVDAMKNPKPGYAPISPEEVRQLGLPPGVYQRGPDGKIDTVAKVQGMEDPIADLRARALAAGLKDGTPEYQQFMLSGGKASDGRVIESDGQGGFRIIEGAGAGAAAGKPFTEGQSKDVVFSTRARGALAALDPIANSLTDRTDAAAGWIPFGFGGSMQTDDYQVAKTAGDEFLQAILRKDTGAAITKSEQDAYGDTYLPRPGDSAARLEYKAMARKRAVDALEAGMSPAQILAQENALSKGPVKTAPQAPSGQSDDDYLKSLGLQ